MRRSTALLAAALLLAPLALAGCLGTGGSLSTSSTHGNAGTGAGTGTGSATNATNGSGSAAGASRWTATATTTLAWAAAVGGGGSYVGVYPTDACPQQVLEVPRNVTGLAFQVSGGAADPSEPGAGAYTLQVTDPAGNTTTYQPPQGVAGPFNVTASPEAGAWAIQLDPTGADANHGWTLTASLQGVGEAPGNVSFAPAC